MIWNEARECMDRAGRAKLQGEKLVRLVRRVYDGVEYYRRKMQALGVEPGDIRGIADLAKLPFTTREDLECADALGALAVPQSEIVCYQPMGSGIGMKWMAGYTKNDIGLWGECAARAMQEKDCGGCLCACGTRGVMEEMLRIRAHDIYSLGGMASAVACGCECRDGMHVQEDFFIAEVIDSSTLEAVPDGKRGELVLTTLDNEGSPLVRYRTGDITSISREECACGRTTLRIAEPEGQGAELFIGGISVFPGQIRAALGVLEDIRADYTVCVDRECGLDVVNVYVVPDTMLSAEEEERVRQEVAGAVRKVVGMTPKVRVLDRAEFPGSGAGSVTISDNRRCFA